MTVWRPCYLVVLYFVASVEAFHSSSLPLGQQNDKSCVPQLFASSSSLETIDLAPYFQPDFQNAASDLSSTRIVDMVPLDSTTSSSSSSSNPQPLRQQLFTSPLVSVLYERVLPPLWEAGLRIGGPEAEYRAAADFLLEPNDNSPPSVLLDLSCGTGFVGQRFALAQQYDHVFSLDYSPQMLGELIQSLQRQSLPAQKLSIIRGDAGRLPFADDSITAIHWGAALHCVPNAEQALKEVYRVLQPGGKLYATTFLRPFPDVVFRFFTVEELETMAREAGFGSDNGAKLRVQGKGVYGIVKTIK